MFHLHPTILSNYNKDYTTLQGRDYNEQETMTTPWPLGSRGRGGEGTPILDRTGCIAQQSVLLRSKLCDRVLQLIRKLCDRVSYRRKSNLLEFSKNNG